MSAIWKYSSIVMMTTLLATTGCNQDAESSDSQSKQPEQPEQTAAPAKAAEPADTDAAVIAELDAVIVNCLNAYHSPLSASLHDYLYITKGAATFPAKPMRGPVVNKFFGDPAKCRAAADKIKASAPSQPALEAAAAKLASAIASLAPKIAAAHTYYSQKDYKDDNFARGRKLHGPLMSALHAFDAARAQLSKQVSAIQLGMQRRRLAQLAKDPARKLQYLVLDNILTAKKLFAEAGTFKLDHDHLAPHPNDALPRLAGKLRANADALRAQLKNHPPKAIQASRFRMYLASVDDLALAAKELSRRSRSGKPFSRYELSTLKSGRTAGSPRQVLTKYNSMIQWHNRL